jgi:hypothetical protein
MGDTFGRSSATLSSAGVDDENSLQAAETIPVPGKRSSKLSSGDAASASNRNEQNAIGFLPMSSPPNRAG